MVGEAVQFTCNATSLPSSSYEIRHNNVLIRNSTNQVYTIASSSLADEGTYTCVAYNYLGYSALSSINLTMHGKLYMFLCMRACVRLYVCASVLFLCVLMYLHSLYMFN